MSSGGDLTGEFTKREFARRLSEQLIQKGWNQSELARRAEKFLPAGKKFNRDNISNYVNGKHAPGPIHLEAICQALEIESTALFPTGLRPAADDRAPPLYVKDVGDGTAILTINQQLSWAKTLEILRILRGAPPHQTSNRA